MGRHGRTRTGETVELILHSMVIRNENYSVAQIAESLGAPEWTIYEMCNPNSKRQFPLMLLLPLTRLLGDTRLIEHLAIQSGLVTFKVRKRGKSHLENIEDLIEYLRKFTALLHGLVTAIKEKKRFNKSELLQEFDRFLSDTVGLRDDIENVSDQLDLGLGE